MKNAAGSPALAVRELEDRRRISRAATEAREMEKSSREIVSKAASHGVSEGLDVLMGGSLNAAARVEPSSSLARTGGMSRKRKSSAVEENNDQN